MEKPTEDVVVPEAPPRMFSAWSVVVPLDVIEKALEAEVVANVVGDDVAR